MGEAAAVEELPCSVLGVGLGSGAGIVEATKYFRFVTSVLPLVCWLSWWGLGLAITEGLVSTEVVEVVVEV